jgi:hypothetical protein
VGIMGVVTEVGRKVVDEREPTWEEAVAAHEAGTPVEIVRPKRQVTVVYRYTDGVFTATSPQLRSLRATGANFQETRRLARQDLDRFLDPAVDVVEIPPRTDPQICTAAAGRGQFNASSLLLMLVPSSSGTGRAFVSSSRISQRRVPA